MAFPADSRLPYYEYKFLRHDALRIFRLYPAIKENLDLAGELVERALFQETDGEGEPVTSNPAQSSNPGSTAYEALSWCWGRENADQLLSIHEDGRISAFYISPGLKTALLALRHFSQIRELWIDAICINQKNAMERSQQVPRMDRIYGNAWAVCVWLGPEDDDSRIAMEFIKYKVVDLWEFDKLVDDPAMARQWAAFVALMKRPWFSRRWVIQEIALASPRSLIYCGKETLPWKDFVDAVSLFLKVESARNRLADLVKRDLSFGHIPDFGNISSLGAALLVNVTRTLFRNLSTGGERQPVSSLEYLVSSLSVFEATQPRDTIYALLSIAKDATRIDSEEDMPVRDGGQRLRMKSLVLALFGKGLALQSYKVDYKLPVIDVYKEFIHFSIMKADKTRALDILCRPWAPSVLRKHDDPGFLTVPSPKRADQNDPGEEEIPMPSWIPNLNGAAFAMKEHFIAGQPVLRMERQNADPLVGMPGSDQIYHAAGSLGVDLSKVYFKKYSNASGETSMFVRGFIVDEVSAVYSGALNGNMPYQWLKAGGWHDLNAEPPNEFWRTLVADRGEGANNPPTYFSRACKEMLKFKTKPRMRGSLDIHNLVNEGRCSTVAEFLSRVQAVIWNRYMVRTAYGRLGLVRDDVRIGDQIGILYGCSVPVILRKIRKSEDQIVAEQELRYQEWLIERERMVLWIQQRWRMRKQRERHSKDSGKRRAKITWPLPKTIELPETKDHEDSSIGESTTMAAPVVVERQVAAGEERGIPSPFQDVQSTRPIGEQAIEQGYDWDSQRRKICDDYYTFLGEAYAHGLMNGEGVKLQNNHDIPQRIFEMR